MRKKQSIHTFLLWGTIISFPIFAMELPSQNNNNNSSQKTISHLVGVQSLKELCCEALAQHIGAYCKKKHIWFPASKEAVDDICDALNINVIVNEAIFDDLVRIAATTPGKLKRGCYVDYGCTEFLHPRISLFLTRNDKTWEIYNPEMNCTTGSVPFSKTRDKKRFVVSPCAKILALCGKDMLSLYDLEASMQHAWYELGQHGKSGNPKLLSTYIASLTRTFFLNSKTLIGMDQGNTIYALDVDSGETTIIHDVNTLIDVGAAYNLTRITDRLFVYVYPLEKKLIISLLRQHDTGIWSPPREVGMFEGDYRFTYPTVILATNDSPPQVAASKMMGSVVLYTIGDTAVQERIIKGPREHRSAEAAAFSPQGESLAVVWGDLLQIYRLADLMPIALKCLKSSPSQIIWPSYEVGVVVPEGEVMFYNTVVAHVLARYKQELEQNNNNNNTAKIDA